jgi:hypothetical protein
MSAKQTVTDPDVDARLLALIAEANDDDHTPTISVVCEQAVEAKIAGSMQVAYAAIQSLRSANAIRAFEVDGFGPFLAVAGREPALEDLPKAGDEIVWESADSPVTVTVTVTPPTGARP